MRDPTGTDKEFSCINTTYEEPVVKWVTFRGETPANIFDAGETEKKEKIYIGRGQIKMKFFPGQKYFIPGRYFPESKSLVVSGKAGCPQKQGHCYYIKHT